MITDLNRRNFLTRAGSAVSAVWISAHWPAIVAAAEHAHQAAKSASPAKFQFFSPEQAVEIDAITARIIPSDETPGAREAGVVYFIDRALTTFSSVTPEQQDKILHSFDDQAAGGRGIYRASADASPFFETVRVHTIVGFLVDPESGRGGNRDAVGWKLIGRDREHMFQPPFGYYDKDYAGWQPNPPDAEKTKA